MQAAGEITGPELAYVLQVFDECRNRPGWNVMWSRAETVRRTGIPRNRLSETREKLERLELIDTHHVAKTLPTFVWVGARLREWAGNV